MKHTRTLIIKFLTYELNCVRFYRMIFNQEFLQTLYTNRVNQNVAKQFSDCLPSWGDRAAVWVVESWGRTPRWWQWSLVPGPRVSLCQGSWQFRWRRSWGCSAQLTPPRARAASRASTSAGGTLCIVTDILCYTSAGGTLYIVADTLCYALVLEALSV